ncbi:ATP-dependent DNA helicase [Aneurinibacillus aneurinilyticus]|uniref:DnaQ family exonuclease/DinG family helicase n=1 Tax=Aneurinibacillus aneurinilyticus ATCC 12856 TaxID=649747 RepID=U1WQY2_ANEAE|nr:helicase C-terminal domain-containing protein [Aneurinibacillus aneurinilyticus]ERI05045.1 DnaQ family exonuclease/DinG family helicase [Aneurinibacillus aneurinilyticus ATCC 12856]MED0708758.1 helicase C-terminal domain-containing protein [Aneurinibacillus aneurinilyticus]MED0724281.1 helicase C-terminal domain-containing protein [Aneurinibacillus aneurinilyticus]MED0734435.1 helicase C-terminal domain-containing protein [Aneurinibacillus aneurinilyticus]MED0739470.1 helicase C-terminal do
MATYSKTLHRIFKRNGILAGYLPQYQPRRAQFEMANLVLRCLKQEQHGLIEAGTGTGKSFGYTLPAAWWALKNEKRVIISTNTITLQQQLLEKELPMVRNVIQKLDPELAEEFRYELAKGRGNYICKRRFDELLKDSLSKETQDMPILNRLKNRLPSMKKGDRDEAALPIPPGLFQAIRGDGDDCLGKNSPFYKECFIQNARKKLQNAQIIVVNHALFFTDLILRRQGGSILPEYDAVIMDEAHRVEDQVTKQYTYHVSIEEVNTLFNRFLKKRAHWARELDAPDLHQQVESIRVRLTAQLVELFAPLARVLTERPQNEYLLKKSIVAHDVCKPFFTQWKMAFIDKRKEIEAREGEGETVIGLSRYIAQIEQMEHMVTHVLLNQSPDEWATWVSYEEPARDEHTPLVRDELAWGSMLHLYSAPIDVSELLREELFEQKTVILTSATLTTQGDFSFVANRMGIDEYETMETPSPFKYDEQAVLLVPEDVPAPTEQDYEAFLIASMKEIVASTQGRTFFLFTSYGQMNRIYEAMLPWLEKYRLNGLLHGPDMSRDQLLQQFRTGANHVLFGCESFWEGVDVPGDDLVCVVIAKLPFPVPSDPLTQARTERLRKRGRDSFMEYMLPFSILRLKQGFGRLIRTRRDRGVVVILDSRLHTKRYGAQVLSSLPPARLAKSMEELHRFFTG